MTHVMIDLETLGTAPGCVVLSIGAVVFRPEEGFLAEEFEAAISVASSIEAGLVIDPLTLKWWKGQSEAAQAAAFPAEAQDIYDVLLAFETWLASVGATHIWGHGASFDPPVLEAAYRAIKWPAPWKYSAPRCTRTLYELSGVEPDRSQGVHHNALNDAKVQAVAAIEALRRLTPVKQAA